MQDIDEELSRLWDRIARLKIEHYTRKDQQISRPEAWTRVSSNVIMVSSALAAFQKSFLWQMLWLTFGNTWGFAQVYVSRWQLAPTVVGNEHDLGFGQLVPLLLLALPVVAAIEGYTGMLSCSCSNPPAMLIYFVDMQKDISENHKMGPVEFKVLRPETGATGNLAPAIINAGKVPSQIALPVEGHSQSAKRQLLDQVLQPNSNRNIVHERAKALDVDEIELLREAELLLRVIQVKEYEKLSRNDLEAVVTAIKNSSDPADEPIIILSSGFQPYLGAWIVVYFEFTIYVAVSLSFATGDGATLSATILVFVYMVFSLSGTLVTIVKASVGALHGY